MKAPTWELKEWRIEDLHENPQNPRKISDSQRQALRENIDEFGTIERPVVNKDGQIIGGHQRVEIFRAKGVGKLKCWTPSRKLNHSQANKLMLRLNKVGGEWDNEILRTDFSEAFLLESGWDDSEISEMWGKPIEGVPEQNAPTETQVDEALEEPEVDESDLQKRLETYNTTMVRQVVLYYDAETFEELQPRMLRARKSSMTDDNSELFMHLLRFYEERVAQ